METVCTLVTYEDGKKKIIYERDPVLESGVATISYPLLTSEEIQKIEETTWDRVQELLSKY